MQFFSMLNRRAAMSLVVGMAASFTLAQNVVVAQPGGGGGGGGPRAFGGGMGMFGGMGGGGDMDPRLNTDALARYSKMLSLTPDQADAAKALYEGYLSAHQAKAEVFRTAMEKAREDFRDSRDPSVFQDLAPKGVEFSQGASKAEKGFMDDLKSLLDDKQAANWPAVERAQRREVSMKRGLMSGERPDLVKIVEKLDLPTDARATVAPVLDTYEQDLDRELVKRDEFSDKMREQFGAGGFRNVMGNPDEMAKVDEMIKQGREYATKVRDVNRRYAKQIESVLPEPQSLGFANTFHKESFPDIYRERYAQKVVDAAGRMEGVSPDAAASIQSISEQYTREAAALNTRAEVLTQQQEENFSMSGMMARMGGGGDPAQRELRTQRDELENSTVKKVKELLTPEQQAKLPERRAEDRGPGGPGGRGNGANGGNNNRGNRGNRGNQPAQGGL